MRPSATLLLLAATFAAAHAAEQINDRTVEIEDAQTESEGDRTSGSDEALDGEHEPVVRKKRTFGDVVFRGLADVLGYNVARKPPSPFPPPLDPVPGIDTPLQAGPPPPPPSPCGAPRAAPPPCRAPPPPKPRPPPPPPPPPPPCPKPRAVPRPKPRPPPPPPPPPPPCAKPRANPTTPSPCAPPPPPPPPPKDSLETITSNFRLDFNFNRNPAATPAPAQDRTDDQFEQYDELAPTAQVALAPRAARLPQEPARKPRVFVDAHQAPADDDYLAYDDDDRAQYDDYEDAQESRDRAEAVKKFGTAVDRFWKNDERNRPRARKILPDDHYQNVHFGDRALADLVEKKKKKKARSDRVSIPAPEADEEDAESTTTTEDPHRKLKPRVLPPTEHNPNNIDTVTVRVPPIYRERSPKKYHRGRTPERDAGEDRDVPEFNDDASEESDAEGEDTSVSQRTERPRKRRRKPSRRARSTREDYSAGDYDYYGKKLPVSDEEKYYTELTVPKPTRDADRARHEDIEDDHFLNDHERISEDPERQAEDSAEDDEHERDDENERADEKERSQVDDERTSDQGKADERERTDKLSPNAKVHLSGYSNKYLKAHNVQVDNPRPVVATVSKKTRKIGA